jgi:hypothetical protein
VSCIHVIKVDKSKQIFHPVGIINLFHPGVGGFKSNDMTGGGHIFSWGYSLTS